MPLTKTKKIILASAALLSLIAFSQTRACLAADGGTPAMASEEGLPIEVRSMTEKRTVTGRIARTVVDIVLFNPNKGARAGELGFPLSERRTVTGFAFESGDGEMRDAVAVDGLEAREAFAEVARPGTEPAMPALPARMFRMMIQPLNPGETRRARISYMEAESRREPAPKSPLAYAGDFNGKKYFYAEVPADIFTQPPVPYQNPDQISILWDASLSGGTGNQRAEFSLLSEFFARNRNVRANLQIARDTAEPTRYFEVWNGNWDELRDAIRGIAYDGATNLGAFDTDDGSDVYLLFSDGLDNYGIDEFSSPKNAPLFAFSSSSGANRAKLQSIAARTGGRAIDISGGATDVEAAVSSMETERPVLAGISSEGASDFAYSQPDIGDTTIGVAGVLEAKSAAVTLVFAMPGTADGKRKFRSVKFTVGPRAEKSNLAPLIWALMRLAKLEAGKNSNRSAIIRLGMDFNLPTDWTSLLIPGRTPRTAAIPISPDIGRAGRVEAGWLARIEWWETGFPKGALPPTAKRYFNPFMILGSTWPGRPALPAESAGSANIQGSEQDVSAKTIPPNNAVAVDAPAAHYAGKPPAVQIAPFSPASPVTQRTGTDEPYGGNSRYRQMMEGASSEDLYSIYIAERPKYAGAPDFYMDTADILLNRGMRAAALRVLSNIAETAPGDGESLRSLGYKLMELSEYRPAARIFADVASITETATAYHDLALAFSASGDKKKALASLVKAAKDGFSSSAHDVAAENALTDISAMMAGSPESADGADGVGIDPILLRHMPLGLRVLMEWDSEGADFQLHVTDPNGQDVSDNNAVTYQGGRMRSSGDAYGPSEFALRDPKPGRYRVEAQFTADGRIHGRPPMIFAVIFRNYGEADETARYHAIRSGKVGERILIDEFAVE
ncbi:MAG: hypothetical protein LBT08_03010 [Synergistaceae bacterium]|nr:hypothetical protein [Synergistaceae bacterium]